MKKKIMMRLICALLSVLMLVGMIPALTLAAAAATDSDVEESPHPEYTEGHYKTAEDYLAKMKKYYSNGAFSLYCDEAMGIVAYRNEKTGEIMFTNPWNVNLETNKAKGIRAQLMSQIIFEYSGGKGGELTSYTDAAMKGQIIVKSIKNGLRVEYAIGDPAARVLVPHLIERSALENKLFAKITEAYNKGQINKKDHDTFKAYFNEFFYTDDAISDSRREQIAKQYPVAREKNIDLYVLDKNTSVKQKKWIEKMILTYCPDYTFEIMDEDYDFVNYVEEATSPAVFNMALEYVLDGMGLSVSLAGNGLRYDEKTYKVKNFQILPYMGASYKQNEGYSFIPDGSGVLYELDSATTIFPRVYGDDYALFEKLYSSHNETVRMPVFGQVETAYTDKNGNAITKKDYAALSDEDKSACTSESRGFFAIIEKGDSLAFIRANHSSNRQYASVIPEFITRQSDLSSGGWSVYADRRYTDDYSIRYIMLNDDARAKQGGLSSYYECSWLGMACAYRDYLSANNKDFNRLTKDDVSASIPLYIETFGCMDTMKKVLSMPVTVSVAITSFEDIGTMYDYLAANGVSNVNFKMKGYANGGLFAEVPYDLDWESAVGGDGDFEDLLEKAKAAGFGLYPDFDFVYTTGQEMGSAVNMKKHAARTIDNRYTSKRMYSATYQTLVSHFQMVMSPATYSRFYEELEEEYAEFASSGISLGTFGDSLNSDYDEEKITLREEAKKYVVEGLAYFKNKNYDIMVDGGNAYTWNYASHILNVPLDSSRYIAELSAVPFAGVVLHGYREFAGSAMNMEGNLSYAMLKAMESGAAPYFILSYANTELLKEDEVLSQNYSVRYDIWQKRLVEIYQELNAVLADVQTKLLVNHERLDASRVPDEDELLKDIADAAEQKKQEIAQKIEQDRLDRLEALSNGRIDVTDAPETIDLIRLGTVKEGREIVLGQLAFNMDSGVMLKWVRPSEFVTVDEKKAKDLASALNTYVITPYMNMKRSLESAKETIAKAKAGYDLIMANDVDNLIKADAFKSLNDAIDSYIALLNASESVSYSIDAAKRASFIATAGATIDAYLTVTGTVVTVSDAELVDFIFGQTKSALHDTIGVKELYDAVIRALILDGYYDPANSAGSLIDIKKLESGEVEEPAPEPEPDEGEGEEGGEGEGEDTEVDIVIPDPPKSKYAVDNNVVAVTYGESKVDIYKTLLLNFNDYTIQTTYNGVTYTIEAYDYVVIMH